MHDKILIVDFGSQVTQLIARRVREERVYCEIVPFQQAEAALRELKPKAVIPMHYATFPLLTGTPEAFQNELKARGVTTELIVMKPGETIS